mgnify:CR=1 FL=1
MASTGTHANANGALTLAFVRGVLPGKWQRIWNRRHPDAPLELLPTEQESQLDPVRDARADLAFVRLPLGDAVEPELVHVIPLYEEVTVVLASADHVVAAADEVTAQDLEGELVHPTDATLLDTIEVVRAGVGVLVLPQSVARLTGGKGLEWRPLRDAAPSRIALVWPRPGDDADAALVDDLDEFVGVVRGRGENSSRGRSAQAATTRGREGAREAEPRRTENARPGRRGGGSKPTPGRSRTSRNGRSGRR